MKIIESGQLTVAGHSAAKIKLKKKPHHFEVKFCEDEPRPICAPHHNDHLEAILFEEEGFFFRSQFYLIIRYKVESVRTICWSVSE